MIVFNTFLKVVKSSLTPIIMFTLILIIFGITNFSTNDNSLNFEVTKPDILIINNDKNEGLTKNLIEYLTKNSNIIKVKDDKYKIDDALFYRDVNYVIIIPKNFKEDFLNNKNPEIQIKSTKDYQSSLAEMMLERYIKVASIYKSQLTSEDKIIENINETLSTKVDVLLTSKLDANNLNKMTFFYNFANYSILAGCVYVICLILSSFKNENIKKRTIISSMNYKEYNRKLLLSNSLFVILLWLFYCILSLLLIGKSMFTYHGLIYILNLFIFSICSLSIAFLIGNLINNKNAINGIVNIIALGSSFLCGAFVPLEFLPTGVINIAHVLPSYYYIKTNEIIKSIEVIDIHSLKPVLANVSILILFTIGFSVITNIISKNKQKIG